jgi:hypothetical protein
LKRSLLPNGSLSCIARAPPIGNVVNTQMEL